MKTLVDQVSSAGVEQARGTDQIGQAVVQMQQVTQTIAAQAEESAAAAEEVACAIGGHGQYRARFGSDGGRISGVCCYYSSRHAAGATGLLPTRR
ncbi:MAG: hypothetical protein WDO73_17000 [Ignavibacteriota bacterium]